MPQMKPKSTYSWQELVTNLLIVTLPFFFIILMGSIRTWLGLRYQPLYILLENPMLLMLSTLFAYAGTELGRYLVIKNKDPQVYVRIRATAMGVSLTLGALAIIHFLANGGVINPK